MKLESKVAIVTGGASGFGKAICETYAKEGAKVVVADINGQGAREVAKAIGKAAAHVAVDVSKKAEVDALVAEAVKTFGGLDIMVNNAGYTHKNQPMLDVGEEEFTSGRPHPMIDPGARTELIRREGRDPSTAVVLIDVVLGHGAHPDPAGVLAPACADVLAHADGPPIVAYVLGTERDPQGYLAQRRAFEDAGCILAPTAARAALVAAAIAARRPELAEEAP